MNAKNYAPEVLADGARPRRGSKPSKARAASVRAIELAMERAFEANAIRVVPYGPASKGTRTIAIC